MFDFDELSDADAESDLIIPSLDGEWQCSCDYFGKGKMMSGHMCIIGTTGWYVMNDHKHDLTEIAAARNQEGQVSVTFRWHNCNGSAGTGTWALRSFGRLLDGTWSSDKSENNRWRWVANKIKDCDSAPQNFPDETVPLQPELPALPSLDGEWEAVCDVGKCGRIQEIRMRISGAVGEWWVEGKCHKLSDISIVRDRGTVKVDFCWTEEGGFPAGDGNWIFVEGWNKMNGTWSQYGLDRGPFLWNCQRKLKDMVQASRDIEQLDESEIVDLADRREGEAQSKICAMKLATLDLDGEWMCLCDLSIGISGKLELVIVKIKGAAGHYERKGIKHNIHDIEAYKESSSIYVSFSWKSTSTNKSGSGKWMLLDAGHCLLLDGSWELDGTNGGPWQWFGVKSRPELSIARWRCIFKPRIVIRAARSVDATALRFLSHDEVIEADVEPVEGWVTLANQRGFALITHETHGRLMERIGERVSPGFMQKLKAGRRQIFVAYGTSLTSDGHWLQHLVSALEQAFPEHREWRKSVFNCGERGVSSAWGVENFSSKVLAKWPDVLFLEFAVNDACKHLRISKDKCRQNLHCMIDCVQKECPHCEVVLLTTNPCCGEHHDLRPELSSYYQVYREVACELGLLMIDVHLDWLRTLARTPDGFEKYIPDGLHPGELGDASVTTPAILRTLGLEPILPQPKNRKSP